MADDIAMTLRAMLGGVLGVGVTDPRDPTDDLWPTEREGVARAIPRRVMEFAAGRRAARQAMAALNLPAVAILTGSQREPLWSAGLVGSIAHCETHCIAAVSKTHAALGIDIEQATPLDTDLIPIVCNDDERCALDTLPANTRGLAAKRIFCAKEAVYKAQYPLTRQVIGFDAVSIMFDKDTGFTQVFHAPMPNLPPLRGQIMQQHGLILASASA